MSYATRVISALAVAAALGVGSAAAQAPAGSEIVSVNVYGGGFSPTTDLSSSGGFRRSGAVGGAVTLWVHPNVGVRGNLLFARPEVGIGAPEPIVGEKPNVWAYSGDVVLRAPFGSPNRRDSWFPYLVGGVGAKSYDFDTLSTQTDFAGNFGGGLEYRVGSWGLQAEVRDIVSRFDRLGARKTQHDIVWTAGITRSF